MNILNKISVGVLGLAIVLGIPNAAFAATAVNLGTAQSYAVLAGSTITNTGSSVINGDLGLSPGTSVTGFPPGTVNGTQHITDAAAAQAQTDLITAYNAASGQTGGVTISGDLGGRTLTPGVYNSSSSMGLTGTLTLDGQGDPNAVFVFQAGSTLTTASASNVVLTNSAQACNVFWQVGASATLGTNSNFVGSIMTLTSITVTTGASISGRVLARNGAVTLDTNTITRPVCAAAVVTPTPEPTPTPTPTPVVTPPPVVPAPVAVAPTLTPIVPGLPNTGVNPNSQTFPWQASLMLTAGLALAGVVLKRKQKFSGR